MTTEFVLILGLYAFLLLGAFLGDRGPISTFKKSAPRLAAKIERDISVGKEFKDGTKGDVSIITWKNPNPGGDNP